MGIGKISAIKTVCLKVALKKKDETAEYTFSRAWTVPCTVLQLSVGPLALKNITFLVADDSVESEDLLIGLPVLRHLRVDTKTLLEKNIEELDGTDCSLADADRKGLGNLGRLMVSRLNRHVEPSPEPSSDRPRVDYNRARKEEDPFPDPSLLDPVDSSQHNDIKDAVATMVQSAKTNGLPKKHHKALEKTVSENVNIFRCAFSSGPPSRLPPLKIELTPDAKPVKVRLRNYSADQCRFMGVFIKSLVDNGMAYPNPTAKWACAPLLVPKPSAEYRFTSDVRPVNKYTVKNQYPMPNLEHELTIMGESKPTCFANFDMSHSYWQLLLALESQECQSMITPDGIFSPTRVLHGNTNAVAHLQSSLTEIIPDDLKTHIIIWLDDILIFASSPDELMTCIASFFGLCVDYNIKLHPAKCILFSTEVRWCGRLITPTGVRYDPRRLQSLLDMEPPTTGAHLQQFVCALQWVKQGIPGFTEIVAPLQDFMEKVYAVADKRTKRAVSRIKLSDNGWGTTELTSFETCKSALAKQVTLSHRDQDQRLCVYTDASDLCWSGIITQVPHADLCKPHKAQRHSPLAFLSGRFNATQLGWSVLEKEAYAVLHTLDRMHWLVTNRDGFDLFTDHNNLIFIFDPLSVVPDLSQTTLRKVLRWAVRLSLYQYTCYHITGEDNVWADLLTRWSNTPPTIRRLVRIPELPSAYSDDFEWPQRTEIGAAQAVNAPSRPAGLVQVDGLWSYLDGATWIPDGETDLQLRLCIIAHTGAAGHRGCDATERALKSVFKWTTLAADVRAFVRSCIHCLSTTGGEKIPRPFGPAVHGTAPNDLLQFDYIDMGDSKNGDKYVLMLRDDHSDYKMFYCFPNTNAENAAIAIIEWCSMFGVPNMLMSDGQTHFKNETLRLVAKGLKVPHHFTLAYCPWSNGAVERLGRELIRVLRATLSELGMDHNEWTDLIPVVQSVLNNAPSPQRGNVCPVTAFMGHEPSPPIKTFMRSSTAKPVTLTDVQAESSLNVENLVKLGAALHPLVKSSLESHRRATRDAASRGKLPNFTEGDYVLVARSHFHAGEKLCLRWRGPRRVTKALSDFVYQVEELRNGHIDEVHASRLKLYRDSAVDETAILSHVLQSETGMIVSRLLNLEDTPDGLFVRVRWKGLGPDEDSLEPIAKVYEYVPVLFKKLLDRRATSAELAGKARAELAL